MLFEGDVIENVCDLLRDHGYDIESTATVRQHGEDIIAVKGDQRVIIEAKGETSSRRGSGRFGLPFTAARVLDHVAKAVLKALRVAASGEAGPPVALPDNQHHRLEIERVQPALRRAGVGVFWATEDGVGRRAEYVGPWAL